MHYFSLVSFLLLLAACGDDTASSDAGSDAGSGSDAAFDAPSDTNNLASRDVPIEANVDASEDAFLSDAPNIDALHANAAMAAERLSRVGEELRNLFCPCEVDAGEYATLEACYADVPTVFVDDAHVVCTQAAITEGGVDDLRTYNCQVGSFEEYVTCLAALDCSERRVDASGFEACAEQNQMRIEECGDLAPSTSLAMRACRPDDAP